jgi:hypothetical protein
MTHGATRAASGPGLRQWIAGRGGLALAVVLLAASGLYVISWFRGQPDLTAAERNFICSETGKAFAYRLKEGDREPVMSPYTKRPTGYRAEKCYWKRETGPGGEVLWKAKKTPTLVLLNRYKGEPEPTLCPDCGRVVKPHNPLPPMDLIREATD